MNTEKTETETQSDWDDATPVRQHARDIAAEMKRQQRETRDAAEAFGAEIDSALDALAKRACVLADEYGAHTGKDHYELSQAVLYRRLQNRIMELGRRALMSIHGSGLPRFVAPSPHTNYEVHSALREAMALYESVEVWDKEEEEPATCMDDAQLNESVGV